MNASRRNLLDDVLGKTQQLLIPVYQRQYSWKIDQCRQLWNDILYAGEHKEHHFMGSVVCAINDIHHSIPMTTVIDGQQRLTTLVLLLAALARKISHSDLKITPEKIRNTYLLNQYEEDEYKHRLILSEEDRESLKTVIDCKNDRLALNRDNLSLNIGANFSWFESKLDGLKKEEYEYLWDGLRRLSIIEMTLDKFDNPQRIFETMNSTGLDLTQSDQIRNYVLMGVDSKEQTQLYNKYWRGMEKIFGQVDYEKHFDDFVRRYLTMHVGTLKSVQRKDIYKTFRQFHKKDKPNKKQLLSDMLLFTNYYTRIALPNREPDNELSMAFRNIRTLKADVSYPLLMCIYCDYEKKHLQKPEFMGAIGLLESYIFRRSVCRLPTSDTGSAMLRMLKEYKTGGASGMRESLLKMGGERYFPSDDMFKTRFKLYPKHLEYWPLRLENHYRAEPLSDAYTIEHIMPQTLPAKWQEVIGPNWSETHQQCINLPGNITLTKYNSELSNLVYSDKYHKPKIGYKHNSLKINESLLDTQTWDKDTIDKRSEQLAELAVECWPR